MAGRTGSSERVVAVGAGPAVMGSGAPGRIVAELCRERTRESYREFRLRAASDELTGRERAERAEDISVDQRMAPERKAQLEALVGTRVRFRERHVAWDGKTVYRPQQEFRVIARSFDKIELFLPPGGWKRPAMRLVVSPEWIVVIEEADDE